MHRRVRNVCVASLMFHLLFPGNVNMLLFTTLGILLERRPANKYRRVSESFLPTHIDTRLRHVVINCHCGAIVGQQARWQLWPKWNCPVEWNKKHREPNFISFKAVAISQGYMTSISSSSFALCCYAAHSIERSTFLGREGIEIEAFSKCQARGGHERGIKLPILELIRPRGQKTY